MARGTQPLSQWLGCRCLGFGYGAEIGWKPSILARRGISDMDEVASTIIRTSFSYSSSPFVGPKFSNNEPQSPPFRVSFRPFSVSASCASTAERPTSHNVTPTSLYEVLGIQMGATCQEIKAAYRKLARTLHPDVAANGQKEDTAYEFIKVHEAYETLSDPEKRADYDRSLFRPGR
ncbi:unnamed protein product [Dovyalis caffra]|uniref:J domain-containing protein n=1 Tax=Dovyalis caffra TaxID=77055 RepID=A0AAV1S754_9ROSI|nr:unnamed protein product [Dovyalis caffra]